MPFLFPKPPKPPSLPPPPAVVTREDPNVILRAQQVADAEKRRKGRRASIITSPGQTGDPLISQPELSAADKLGQ